MNPRTSASAAGDAFKISRLAIPTLQACVTEADACKAEHSAPCSSEQLSMRASPHVAAAAVQERTNARQVEAVSGRRRY
jgi:hypothetical protein